MASTRIPLAKWIAAIHLASHQETGVTARDLSLHLAVTMRCAYHLIERMRDGASHVSVRRLQKAALADAARTRASGPKPKEKSTDSQGSQPRARRQRGARFTLWPLAGDDAVRALITLPYSRWLDSH